MLENYLANEILSPEDMTTPPELYRLREKPKMTVLHVLQLSQQIFSLLTNLSSICAQ